MFFVAFFFYPIRMFKIPYLSEEIKRDNFQSYIGDFDGKVLFFYENREKYEETSELIDSKNLSKKKFK